MKWGYMITIIDPNEKRPRLYSFKNAKSAWKAYCHLKRFWKHTRTTVILAKNTRIIAIKLPDVDVKSTKPNIEPIGGAKN